MIRSFKHRGLKRLHDRGDRGGIRPDLVDTVERILTVLDSATTPQALDIPRYRLHPLKGDLKELWAVTMRANWRIVFRFEGTDAFDVEPIDDTSKGERHRAHEKSRASRPHRPARLP